MNTMHVEDFVVLGRTVPEESKKYGQRICMAGYSLENNQFLRIYPLFVPVGENADTNGFRARYAYFKWGPANGKDTQLPATHPAKVRIIEVSSKIWKIRALIPTPSSSHPTCGSRMRMVNTTFKSGNGVRTDCLPNPSTLTRRMCCGERPVIAGDMAC